MPSKGSWIDLGLLLWLWFMGLGLAPGLLRVLSSQLAPWQLPSVLLVTLTSHVVMAGVLLLSLLAQRDFWAPQWNTRPFRAATHGLQALQGFFIAIPLLMLAGTLWQAALSLAKAHGWVSDTEVLQPMVVFLNSTQDKKLLLWLGLQAVVVAPVLEEILFRAGLYRWLKGRVPRKQAVAVSSLAFALAHQHLGSFVPLWVLGALMTEYYEGTGHLGTPIMLHALFNLNTLCLIALGVVDALPSPAAQVLLSCF
jgi:membrane protease YdiL (CAAX protease family)